MNISDAGVALVKQSEGFSARAYRCPAGKLTIGYGHTGDDFGPKDIVTRQRAEEILRHDLAEAEAVVNRYVKVALTQNQFDALVSFVFNVGGGKFRKSMLLALLNNGDYDGVPAQLVRWNKIGKTVSRGLVMRRQAEADLWMMDKGTDLPMPQEVTSPDPKPLAKSRTVANASVAGGVGVVLAAAPAIEPAGKVVELAQNNTQGFFIVIGLALVVFAAIAIYLRWDDGRKAA